MAVEADLVLYLTETLLLFMPEAIGIKSLQGDTVKTKGDVPVEHQG